MVNDLKVAYAHLDATTAAGIAESVAASGMSFPVNPSGTGLSPNPTNHASQHLAVMVCLFQVKPL